MKSLCSFLFLFLGIFLLSACSHKEKIVPRDIASLEANGGMEGIWFLQGTSSSLGPYNGELELRKSHDGTFDVVRVATYINYFFDGLKVQEVWTGKAVASADSLVITYDIRQGDFITRLGKLRRQPTDFQNSITVIAPFKTSAVGFASQFSDRKTSSYTEWITTRRNLEVKPLWVNQRRNVEAQGKKIPQSVRSVIKLFKMNIGYDKDSRVKSYKDRAEFREEKPYVVFDPTDFEFYRNNKDVIRVVNKVSDEISMTEAVVKRNAYAPSLQDKAKGFDRNSKENHVNQVGMLALAKVDENGKLLSFIPDDEAPLWTGMYVASQAMRYQLTQDDEALQNVRKSVQGLMMLMDITGSPQEFARTIAAYDPSQVIPEKWHRGQGAFANYIWLEGGNGDMLMGVIHGMLWASLVIPRSDTEIWNALKDKSRRLTDLQIMTDKPQNRVMALGLAAWITGDSSFKDQYRKVYESIKSKVSGNSFDTPFYWRGTADWRAINLGIVGDITDITLADLLGENKIRDQLRERLMDAWVTYEPAQRQLLTMVAYAFAYKYGTRGENFRAESSEVRFDSALTQSVWGLREIPYPRPNIDVTIDHSYRSDWCMSPIPQLFWKPAKKPQSSVEFFYQGLHSYPVFELQAYTSNFVWRDSAFLYKGGHSRGDEYSGVDYLYAYWLARYAGIQNVDAM